MQLFCVCDVYCTVYVYYINVIVSYKSKTQHIVELQSYKLMECHECSTGVILHFLILSGPDMPAYCKCSCFAQVKSEVGALK